MKTPPVHVVLLCAGRSTRLGGEVAKPWRHIGGAMVMRHALEAFMAHPSISGGVVVAAADAMDEARRQSKGSGWIIAEGGAERSDSVRNGLEALAGIEPAPQHVLIHDAARPFVPASVITSLLDELEKGAVAAVPVLPPADSLKRLDGNIVTGRVDREGIARVQTPQAFDFPLILDLHRQNSASMTDDSSLLEDAGKTVITVDGDPILNKITTAQDLEMAERLALTWPRPYSQSAEDSTPMADTPFREFRSASGFDVHRFSDAAGPIMLGGIALDHDRGFDAHSDGDVALHALTDAMFGLVSDGDIGTHFPPSDPQWKDQDSAAFLKEARARVDKAGGVITLADLTIIAEVPKILPHRDAIRRRIADILDLSMDRISVKATTSEGLGFTGRREGIAVMASVTAHFPGKADG
ncbi:2-C-methyl-D-erythritol 4-phosphate cytidylyltransferase [Alphaproteobacteria bacterium LSUCC0684]